MSDKEVCRYCGEYATGRGCKYSPTGLHVKVGDDSKCIFCGSTNYGKGCTYNDGKTITGYPASLHVHGHARKSPRKCIFCGSSNSGKGCLYSPTGLHQF